MSGVCPGKGEAEVAYLPFPLRADLNRFAEQKGDRFVLRSVIVNSRRKGTDQSNERPSFPGRLELDPCETAFDHLFNDGT